MSSPPRTALVTGSGRNIGRAIALELAGAGFNVVVNGSSDREACKGVAAECREAGVKALVAMGSVGDPGAVHAIVDAAIADFGAVDVLVNNAAVRPSVGFLEVTEAEWQRVFDINFNGARWLARACLPGMIERGWGRIINFTGMNAQQGSAGKVHVTASKHAAWGLTKALAKEFGPHGVTANIISPGTIVGEGSNPAHDGRHDALRSVNPSGRLGAPDDIAAMVGLLAGDRAGFVNGQLVAVNGGVAT